MTLSIPLAEKTMSDLLYSLLLLSLFFLTNSNGYSLNSNTVLCPIFSCGNDVTIRYPFWKFNITNPYSYYCGYPQFGLHCSPDTGEPMINISNHEYYVKNISYSDSTLTLVDAEIADLACPRARHNISLDNVPLNYSPHDLNLTFYFNCTDAPDDKFSHIDCLGLGKDGRRSYVFEVGGELNGYDWSENCKEKVLTTVMKGEINTTDLTGEFDVAMKEGFMLNWKTADGCGACEKNGGRCGYNYTKQYLCYCKNGNLSYHDCKGSGFNLAKKLFVGFGAMGVTIILMLAIFFIHQRRNKNRYVGSSYVSRNISSDYSSMTDLENMGNFFGLHIFTYDELEEATDNFDASKELGDGGFGVVYYGKLKDGRVVAVKRLYENNYKRVEQFMNEVAILTRLRHQNLVSLYGCTSRRSQELLLVYEYIPNGTVADHLHGERAKPGSLPWPTRLKIAIETASALTYLHACDIIHRDVKTNNILLDNNFCVKVADFGLSRLFPTDVTHVSTAPQGTPGYVDPDYHQCYQLTDKSDVYSFGVVMIELISSKPAVDITRHRHEINLSNMAINKIQNRALHELVDLSLGFESDSEVNQMITAVAGLAFQCLQSEKDLRPSMEEVLESLKGIQSEVQNVEKPEVVHTPADDAALLKNVDLARSPDSVTVKWMSSSTTPNASG